MPRKKYIPYEIGQFVYLKTDPDKYERQITRIMINPDSLQFELTLGAMASWHYDFEITTETPHRLEFKGFLAKQTDNKNRHIVQKRKASSNPPKG